jgi:tRNA(adenine34) deaminase
MADHTYFLQQALAVAKRSKEQGNLPFGCILVSPGGKILAEGENTVVTANNAIAHCEINLLQQLKGQYNPEFLQQCSVYASTEPCAMCAGAIFWAGIGAVVYALSKEQYHQITGTVNPAHILDIKAEELLLHGGRKVTVLGPLLQEEAAAFYKKLE